MLIDNFATQEESIELEISLQNCDDRMSLTSYPTKPRSKHEFFIFDATNLGFSRKYQLTIDQSSEIFLLACTLLDSRKYLSLYQSERLSSKLVISNLDWSVQPKNTNVSNSIEMNAVCHVSASLSTHLKSPFVVDGNRLFWIIDNFLWYRIFDTKNRTVHELNVIDAIKLYYDSLSATDPRSCYLSMYAAFEKIVNAKEERKGSEFDNLATYYSGLSQLDITHLRELDNRLKHRLRDKSSDLTILDEFEKNPRLELKKLKSATDPAILSVICDHFY